MPIIFWVIQIDPLCEHPLKGYAMIYVFWKEKNISNEKEDEIDRYKSLRGTTM